MTLKELLQTILPRYGTEVPIATFLDASNMVRDVVAQRLWLTTSDLLRVTTQTSVEANSATCMLEDGTLGLAEWPWISNATLTPGHALRPVPPSLRRTFTTTGTPLYFEQRGLTLTFYPTCAEALDVAIEVYQIPPVFTSLSDTLPWDGMFDQVFVEAVPRFSLGGGMLTVTPDVNAFIVQRVDRLSEHRPVKSIAWLYPA